MKLEIITGGESTEIILQPGSLTLGGSDADGIQIRGLAQGLLELRSDGQRLLVVCRKLFSVDDVLSPPDVVRLVVPGERIQLTDDVTVRLLPAREAEVVGTAAVLKELLGGLGDAEDANCPTLTCLTGLDVGRRFPLCGGKLELGRGEDVQLRIRDRAVSRRHARLCQTDEGITIEDLRSPNGVFVNGKLVNGTALLADGALIEIGQTILRYRAPAQPPPPPEPEPAPEAVVTQPEPEPEHEPVPEAAAPSAPPRNARVELAVMGVGVMLAVVGALVSFGLAGN